MDVLVRKNDSTVAQEWPDGITGRVMHPDKPYGALTTFAGTTRPIDFGDFILVSPTVVNGTFNAKTQNRSGPSYSVAGDYSVTATYTLTDKPLADVKAAKLDELAAYRYEQEVGGVTSSGVLYPTDRQSRKDLRDARDSLTEGLLSYVEFKGEDGWLRFTAASQITPLLGIIAVHVRDCFDNEKIHTQGADGSGGINALTTQAAVDAYDITTGW